MSSCLWTVWRKGVKSSWHGLVPMMLRTHGKGVASGRVWFRKKDAQAWVDDMYASDDWVVVKLEVKR